ncbi:MAG TPA: DUF2065 domain-containing protein [Gammaproteobacteria bacterium]|nr:DUF2065 domain-containing protein [Gammaproteobacteria bacterium]
MRDLLAALALVLVIEGVLPFLSPGGFRRAMLAASQLDDATLRLAGLASMVLGLGMLYFARG